MAKETNYIADPRGTFSSKAITTELTSAQILGITAFNGSYVDLSWSTSANHRSKSYYYLLKNDQFLAKLAYSKNTYRDTAMTSGAIYAYRVILVY